MITELFPLDEFIINALIAGSMVAMAAGPLGCFLVWRRMAYFGDTISHSALMGVGLGFAFGSQNPFFVILACAFVSMVLLGLQRGNKFSMDTLLGILAHGALSVGLIVIALQEAVRQNMMYYLIGDILSVDQSGIFGVAFMMIVALGGLVLIWKPLLAITVHEDLARVEGVDVLKTKIIYMLLIAMLVAFAMKIIGVLLITSLMIIPAAAARIVSRNPVQMALFSMLIGVASVIMGVFASSIWDIPTGPSVVLSAIVIFLLGRLLPIGART